MPSPASPSPLHADAGSPPVSAWPTILETRGWSDYALLDFGHGRKLERYGGIVVDRPEPQAMGRPRLSEGRWREADAVFTGNDEDDGPGRWRLNRDLPETWKMAFHDVRFLGRFMSFRHVGVFPEQAAHWQWMAERVARDAARPGAEPPRILNLFGYTGLASLVPAAAGAHVTHIDASKKAIGWARENQELSGLEHLPVRWICEDATKFVAREIKRGNTYDGILLDPPKYGRGPKGEVWDLYQSLPELLPMVEKLLSPNAGFLILTAYAIRSSFVALHELMAETLETRGGRLESGELVLTTEDGARALSTSLFSRWSSK
uniref:class I SAM-dependent methyltransferase n=1 Tax=Stappia sp. TaxID=1870903 RepID=UPI003BAD1684